jgi:uncharacterized protein (TIGR03083 family)
VPDNGVMDPADHLRWLATDASAFLDVLEVGQLTAPVPGCPGWTLADLAAHLGTVHRWARLAVLEGPTTEPAEVPSGRSALCAWWRDGASALHKTLTQTSPDAACWTMAPPGEVRYWMRRQAHETALHRWDAQQSQGAAHAIDPVLAADGVAEVVEMFFPRQVRLGRTRSLRHRLHLRIDGGATHTLAGNGAGSAPAEQPVDAVVGGPPEALLLLLWRRTTLDDPRLRHSGSREAAATVLDAGLTP